MAFSELLASARDAAADRAPSLSSPWPACTLFISLCDGRARASVVNASGSSFAGTWQSVAALALALVEESQLEVTWLRVDWVTDVHATTWGELRHTLKTVKRNYFRYGLGLDKNLEQALLEQELNANAMLYGGGKIPHAVVNEKNFSLYARRRFPGWTADFSDDTPVYRLATAGIFCETGSPPVALLPASRDAGRREIRELDEETVYGLIDRSGSYLATQVRKSGRFHYGWHPCFDRPMGAYNSLRHASTLYAMLEAWEITGDADLLDAVERGLQCLTHSLIEIFLVPGGRVAFLVDEGAEIKLGGNAVCLLALTKYSTLFETDRYLHLLELLAGGICYMQDQDTGRFNHVLNYPDLSVKESFRIIYYDGEAAFGLMRLYSLTGDERWLEMVEKAFDWFIEAEHWRAHDHWLGYCVNELTRYRPDERYFRFGLRNVADYLDFVLTRITTFPTLLELMMAASRMIERIRQHPEHLHLLDVIDLDKFERALEFRARYLMNGHFWPELAMFYKNPARILGSFFIRHHGFRVRIDDVEHYLSGYVAYLKRLRDRGRRPPRRTISIRVNQVGAASAASGLPETGEPPAADPDRVARFEEAPTVAFVGDINLGRRTHYRRRSPGAEQLIDVPELARADCVVGNLECVVATVGSQGIDKGEGGPYYYRARPEMLDVLRHHGFRLVFTANNHSGDYGPEALLEQRKWLGLAGIRGVGAGPDLAAAFEPEYLSVGSARVAFFSVDATQPRYAAGENAPGIAHLPLKEPALWRRTFEPAIRRAREVATHVLVGVHWGRNRERSPSPAEIRAGHALIDAGADAVLGTSAHRLQGVEVYRGGLIIHDAGDFLFDAIQGDNPGGVFTLALGDQGVTSVRFSPAISGFARVRVPAQEQARRAGGRFAALCSALGTASSMDSQGRVYIASGRTAAESDGAASWGEPARLADLGWQVSELPEDCEALGFDLGPLRLLGLRVSPRTLERRRTVEVTSYWELGEPVADDLRLDFQLVATDGETPGLGAGMDHDPCDWLWPTSRWEQGAIYRDYYHLRPPPASTLKDCDLRLQVRVVGEQGAVAAFSLLDKFAIRLTPDKPRYRQIDLPRREPAIAGVWTATELEQVTGGRWINTPRDPGWVVNGVVRVADHARHVPPPHLYVASDFHTLDRHEMYSDPPGGNWDSHRKIAGLARDLAGAIVREPPPDAPDGLPLLQVSDPIHALMELGAAARKRLRGCVVAVTGSAGKTSTVELVATVFGGLCSTFATHGNYNSRVGMLANLASVPADAELVCLEAAVSAINAPDFQNIRLVRPDVGIVTNVCASHLRGGISVAEMARRKANLFEGMAPGTLAIIGRDTDHFGYLEERALRAGLRVLTYGRHRRSDARLVDYELTADRVKACILGEERVYTLGARGEHMAVNSLPVWLIARERGLSADDLCRGFAATRASGGRGNMEKLAVDGLSIVLLDESYNANPLSMRAALKLFAGLAGGHSGRCCLVLGDMLELGGSAGTEHARLLDPVIQTGADQVFLIGSQMYRLYPLVRQKGLRVAHFPDWQTARPRILKQLCDNDFYLMKSSNGTGVHRIVSALREAGTT